MDNTPADDRNLHILYVGTLWPHPGGSAVVNTQILSDLAGLGHSIHAIAEITESTQHESDQFANENPGIDVVRIQVPQFDVDVISASSREMSESHYRSLRERIAEAVTEQHPDVVFIGRESFALPVMEDSAAAAFPSLMILHGGGTHSIIDGSSPPETTARYLTAFRKIDQLVTSAKHFKASVEQFDIGDIEVIPNFISLDRFSPVHGEIPIHQ
jgi:glycosyltransferase involved in cell wall biosynthesis